MEHLRFVPRCFGRFNVLRITFKNAAQISPMLSRNQQNLVNWAFTIIHDPWYKTKTYMMQSTVLYSFEWFTVQCFCPLCFFIVFKNNQSACITQIQERFNSINYVEFLILPTICMHHRHKTHLSFQQLGQGLFFSVRHRYHNIFPFFSSLCHYHHPNTSQ